MEPTALKPFPIPVVTSIAVVELYRTPVGLVAVVAKAMEAVAGVATVAGAAKAAGVMEAVVVKAVEAVAVAKAVHVVGSVNLMYN